MTDSNTIKARIQHLHKTEAEWQSFETQHPDFIPNAGELIIYDIDQENDTPRFKFGNGTSKLSELSFAGNDSNFDAGRITDW
jgi:hypothetical protein